jgi:two-component system, OmpR family, sensor kinase
MSLADRISAFFLAALAVVLLAFSGALYGLARAYLVRQLDQRLETALDTLEAAVDVEPDGLEWEPNDRRITLGVDPGTDQVRWSIRDVRGNLVDRSANAGEGGFLRGAATDLREVSGDATAFSDAPGWRMAGRRLRLEELLHSGRGHPEDDEPDDDVEYPELALSAGVSPAPILATLNRLALALAGTSAATWLACAAMGRRLARRALAPVTRMARSARDLDASGPGWSLPLPGTGDELDELSSAYNELLGRLREAFERQRRFAGDASHQLRTPLAGLLGQIDVALRRDRSAEEYRDVLGIARAEADRLRRIVEALLFLARPEADAAPLEGRPIDLARWLPDQVGRWAEHPRAGDLRAEPAPSADLGVHANPELLAQLLDNLLENAFKYSDPGSPIRVASWREGGAVALAVEDRGDGLDAEEQSRVFEPFYRAERARRRGRSGEGLGLAVAQRIARCSGGSLEVRSEPGRGSRFVLRLPASRPAGPGEGEAGRPPIRMARDAVGGRGLAGR